MDSGIVVARGVAKFLVGHSVVRVLGKTIKANVVAPENRRDKIRLAIATYAISGMVADQAAKWVSNEFDEMVVWVKGRKDVWDEVTDKKVVETTD